MDESIRLGRIAGIRIGMNWSLLVVAGLIAWSLAGEQLPRQFPDYSSTTYWVAGVLASLVFFASLLAHEMAHALRAKREGIEVEGITLWLFGGVAKIRGEALTPGAEFRITIVGPLASVAIAGAFYLVGLGLDAIDLSALVGGTFYWLARINAILAVFNMLPAFPLDGGRVFRALLWRKRDKMRATKIAAHVGRGFGYLMMGFGLVQFVSGADFGGLWFVFLGYFLMNAARAEESHVLLRGALAGVRVRDIMSREVVMVPSWVTLDAFIDDYAMKYRFSTFPVHGLEGATEGLVALAQVKEVPRDKRSTTRVRDIAYPMTAVPVASPGDALTTMLERSSGSPHGRTLVMEDGRIAGIVSPRDLTRALDLASLRGVRLPEGVLTERGP